MLHVKNSLSLSERRKVRKSGSYLLQSYGYLKLRDESMRNEIAAIHEIQKINKKLLSNAIQ